MIRFTIRTLLKNKMLWAWPGIFILFVVAIALWGGVSADPSSSSYVIKLGGFPLPNGIVINQLISITILISIIGIPTHFSENINPDRASLLLSKPISRDELFLSDFAGVFAFCFSYTLISVLLLTLLTSLHGVLFPLHHAIAIIVFLPLILLSYYITIVLFLILTNSYVGGVLLGYFLTGFSSLFLNVDSYLQMFGLTDTWFETLFQILSYLIPSAEAFQQIMSQIFANGLSGIDGSLLGFAFVSCVPFGLLAYYLFRKKQF
ncbi:hypothetical protein CK503_05085 [Aliifodinibius salipaludis]|uniref:ABC transporter permease n=1 Tax=Fodinibius salipaludis TaxID=2032627 RepID=A0A2A2GBX7_9BACT|nr:hypothetical protein [Aliifodinibius salipaludis]PAU94848.1 hypothetical protein CK503_05085 [Aliifodinibius salipaludis]